MGSGLFNACWHNTVTPPDELGEGICADCGQCVTTTLTPALLQRQFDAIRRNCGTYGRHTARCVESDLGWVCADGCTIGH